MRQAILMLPLVVGASFAAPAVHAGEFDALTVAIAEASLRSRFMAAYMELKDVSGSIVQSWEQAAAAVLRKGETPFNFELARLQDQLEAAKQALAGLRKELATGQS